MNDLTPIRLFNIYGYTGGNFAGNVYDTNGLCPALLSMSGGNRQPMILEYIPVAMRGRKETADSPYIQEIEPRSDGLTNSLTTAYKDNLVMEVDMEKLTTRGSDIASTIRATIYKQGSRNLIENLKSGKGYEGIMEMSDNIRIRKLTPTECYKLMGFTAEDCKKASESGISNAQLYKQAGNSIVVNVLEAIFTKLGETYEEFRSVG